MQRFSKIFSGGFALRGTTAVKNCDFVAWPRPACGTSGWRIRLDGARVFP